MATVEQPRDGKLAASAQAGQVVGGLRFDWLFTGLGGLLVGGLYLDGWAHGHGQVDQSFFTPWHALVYSAFALVAALLAWTLVSHHQQGYAWRQALPAGYTAAALGAVIFAVGGVGDLAWHLAFGIEKGIEALISPSHLALSVGGFLMAGGPLRAAWQRRAAGGLSGWGALAPAVLALAYLLSDLTFFTNYAHPVTQSHVNQTGLGEVIGVVGFELQAALLMGIVLLAIRRWRLPVGALALLFALNGLLMAVLSRNTPVLPTVMLYAVLGLAADGLNLWLKPAVGQVGAVRLFAFAVPFLCAGVYFLAVGALGGEIAWSVHVWTGTTVLAGCVGVLVSYLVVPMRLPD